MNSSFVGITTLHVSGILSAYLFHPAPGSKRSSNLQKCTNADELLRNPDDEQKGCPKYVESYYQ